MNQNQTTQTSTSSPSCPSRDQAPRNDRFELTASPTMLRTGDTNDPTYDYAIEELQRLLGRLNINPKIQDDARRSGNASNGWRLSLCKGEPPTPDRVEDDLPSGDGYRLTVDTGNVRIDAATPKGVLNGVYDLAERFGFVFWLPGAEGEWLPEGGTPQALPCGCWTMRPRFAHRGVFLQLLAPLDFSEPEWLRFYAKLRFNAVRVHEQYLPLCHELGLRPEVGGHGLSSFLPRDQFEQTPERFRMFQPEDFNGHRMPDANLCVGNLETKKIVQENFAAHLETIRGAYAVHAWADDLPAGGWCLCPLCRALSPTDQAMLAMRYLAETTAATEAGPRIPVIAYHDTLWPGREIDAPPEGFLLYAPRERCYAHALDDPECSRNRAHRESLDAWVEKFKGIDDAHTFEYYFDQILFRGMYPFLPGVILSDMTLYQSRGIETHMSLQVGGPAIAPEFNMLVFAMSHWDETLDSRTAINTLAKRMDPGASAGWKTYLMARSAIFADAMRMCAYSMDIYLDYRWLPETNHAFGREMADVYGRCADALDGAAEGLELFYRAPPASRASGMARRECGRARFEAAELRVMHDQQLAVNAIGRFFNTRHEDDRTHAVDHLDAASAQLDVARSMARSAGLPEKSWYYRNINAWLKREFSAKAANYR